MVEDEEALKRIERSERFESERRTEIMTGKGTKHGVNAARLPLPFVGSQHKAGIRRPRRGFRQMGLALNQ